MIFDSQQMAHKRAKYAAKPDVQCPWMVFLDRSPHFTHQRVDLEAAILHFPPDKQRRLVADICDDGHGKWRGAWFELMLAAWLRPLGLLQYEPPFDDKPLDFAIELAGQRIFIEAAAIVGAQKEQREHSARYELMGRLKMIKRPVTIKILEHIPASQPPQWRVVDARVTQWIDADTDPEFQFRDADGNRFRLLRIGAAKGTHIAVRDSARTFSVDHRRLRRPIIEKLHQNPQFMAAGLPYVIALYLESARFAAEDVVAAWLGQETVIVDRNSGTPLLYTTDTSGIRSRPGALSHRAVSGLLVFRPPYNLAERPSTLRAWYIQNPDATTPLPTGLFPVVSEYVVSSSASGFYQMEWRTPAQSES